MTEELTVKATVNRHFNARPGRVFDAWLDTNMIGKFMFGPQLRDEEIVSLQTDARVGGSFSFVVRRDGKELDHTGKYLEMIRPRVLAFTWGVLQDSTADASKVVISIVPDAGGCDLSLSHEMAGDQENFTDKAKAAWTKMLEALANALQNV